jgi:RND family efflux transporter MFP subunit
MTRKETRPSGFLPRIKVRAWRVVGVAFSLAAAAGLIWPVVWGETGRNGSGQATPADPTKGVSVPRVEVVRPVRGGVRRLTIQPGSVHAFESVDLYAKASGFLKSQGVDIGSSIKRGEALAEIDAPELQGDVVEAEAAVEQAKAKTDQAVSRVATAEAERGTADAAVTQAESDIARLASRRSLTQKQYNRINDLHARNAIDGKLVDEQQQELESAQAAERTGHAAVATARAVAATAAAKVLEAKADVAEARAALRLAGARLERIKILAAYTRISAPFDGVITRRNFHPGAFIRSAADGSPVPLLTAMRTDLMRVVIQVPDLDVPLLDVGDKVTVAVDALKGREFTGSVARLGKSEDPTTRTMRVEVDLTNPDGLLVEGMYGRATIELQPPTDNLTVPAACVVGHAGRGKAAVFVVRDGIAQRTPVTLGGDDGSSVEVLSGLGPNDEVIVRPGSTLDDGAPVKTTVSQGGDTVRR